MSINAYMSLELFNKVRKTSNEFHYIAFSDTVIFMCSEKSNCMVVNILSRINM